LHDLIAKNQDDDLEYTLPDHLVENIEVMMLDVSTDEFLSAERAYSAVIDDCPFDNSAGHAALMPRMREACG
jgi:hypothetical protein